MVRVCLHLLAKRFWRPWFFGRPGRNCCWTKGGGLAESGPSLLWLVPQPTPSSHSKLKYSQISKCTTTKIHKHASTKNYGFWANGALLLNTSCHKHRPLSPNMYTNMIKLKHRKDCWLGASAALPPRVTNNTHSLNSQRSAPFQKCAVCSPQLYALVETAFEILVQQVGQQTSWQSECAACVQDVRVRHWLVGWCARWVPDMPRYVPFKQK